MSTTNVNIDFVKDINERYGSLEFELDKRLRTIEKEESKLEDLIVRSDVQRSNETNEFEACPSTLVEAKKRNQKLIDELEQSRASLRSRVIYSPLEAILEKAQKNYFATQTKPVRKKFGPVYV